jgi:hypothetical protein
MKRFQEVKVGEERVFFGAGSVEFMGELRKCSFKEW